MRLDELPQQMFAQNVLSPVLWLSSARRLMEAADHLIEAIERFWRRDEDETGPVSISVLVGADYQKIFMMLYGFAIENLCKAYVVTQLSLDERQEVVSEGNLPGRLKKHDLLHLVEREIGLKVEGGERELLKSLKEAVVWAGRYPVSIGPGPSGRHEKDWLEKLKGMPQGIRSDEVPRTKQITERIERHVRGLLKQKK